MDNKRASTDLVRVAILAIVPSGRVGARSFTFTLLENGIRVRPLGYSTGSVLDADRRKARVGGVLLVAANRSEVAAIQRVAQLCGITATEVPTTHARAD